MGFPNNPSNGQEYTNENGYVFTYNASINSWVEKATGNVPLSNVTSTKDGALSPEDYEKISRLVLPPPQCTLSVNELTINKGLVELTNGDDNIVIKSLVSAQNIDEFGDIISQDFPFQIHDFTYGIDFSLNLEALIAELESQGKVLYQGLQGEKGDKGIKGPTGVGQLLCGPPGEDGDQGAGAACTYSVSPEAFSATPTIDAGSVLVNAYLTNDPNNSNQKILNFDRQTLGTDEPLSYINVSASQSPWLLAFEKNNGSVLPSYVDIDPLVDDIHNYFMSQLLAIKASYEAVVSSWVNQMSTMFDGQKAALGCALQSCLKKRADASSRQHMENVAASALGQAKIILRGANDQTAATYVNGDGCSGSNIFPLPPDYGSSATGGTAVPPPNNTKSPLTPTPTPPTPTPPTPTPTPTPPTPTPPTPTPTPTPPTPTPPTPTPPTPTPPTPTPPTPTPTPTTGSCVLTLDLSSIVSEISDRYGNVPITGMYPISSAECTKSYYFDILCADGRVEATQIGMTCAIPGKGVYAIGVSPVDVRVPGLVEKLYWICGNNAVDVVINYTPPKNDLNYIGGIKTFQTNLSGTCAPTKPSGAPGRSIVQTQEIYPAVDGLQYIDQILSYPVHVDAAFNNSRLTSAKLNLNAGKYLATIRSANTRIGKKHRSDVKFTYINKKIKTSAFLFKGEFDEPSDAKDIYEGLSVSFDHDGGITEWWFQTEPGVMSSGITSIAITEQKTFQPQMVTVGFCTMPIKDAKRHEVKWKAQECDGCVINMLGQDYAIISMPDESQHYDIFRPFGRVAFAFPTFNGIKLLLTGDLRFKYDSAISDKAIQTINEGKLYRKTGRLEFDVVLFPL